MAADDPRSVVVNEIAPIGNLGEPPVMSLRLGPALVPVISICAVKAADGNKEDADEAAAKCVQRRGIQFAKSFPIPKQAAGKEIKNTLRDREFGCVADIRKRRLTGQPIAFVVPERTELSYWRWIEIGVFLPEEVASCRDKVFHALRRDDRR